MAKLKLSTSIAFRKKPKVSRPGVHSKNASKNKKGYKNKYRGQGK